MGRIATAFRLFFKALGDADFAARVAVLLQGPPAIQAPRPSPPAPKIEPTRSEALSLLCLLQREGRLVDFLKEDISSYADAQIGAAVRDIHRDCAAAIERAFTIRPLRTEPEGAPIDPSCVDPAHIRLVGKVTGQGPQRGSLRHAGWQATKVELPTWTGSPAAGNIIAPAEVEV